MGTIFYGVTGEGRGHATRAHTMVENLRQEHKVVIYAAAMAYDMLAPLFAGTNVEVFRIPGLLFGYNKKGRIHYGRTARRTLEYLKNLPALIKRMKTAMKQYEPDLVITDFEPGLPRAAHALGIPYISIDHQHFLKVCDLSALPVHLRMHAAFMSQIVDLYYRNQKESVVSSFYAPPLKPKYHNVTRIGVLLKPAVLEAEVSHGDHLVAYLRRVMSPEVEAMLKASGRKVLVYGLGEQPDRGNLSFKPIDPSVFIDDLATSAGLVSTAGNQLVGEAFYLGKPALVMPEAGNHEQEINGWFVHQGGTGLSIPIEAASADHMNTFLNNLEDYRANIDREGICGNTAALAAVRRHMPGHYQPTSATPVLALRRQTS